MRRALPRGLDLPSGSPQQYFFVFFSLFVFQSILSLAYMFCLSAFPSYQCKENISRDFSGLKAETSNNLEQYSTEYTECQAFCPVVRIGSHVPHPLTHHKGVLLPLPVGFKGADTLACGRGSGGPNSNEGKDTLLLSIYYKVFPLRI